MDLRRQKKEKEEEAAKRREAQDIARRLFPSRTVGSTGSVKSASDSSMLLSRVNQLLPSKEVHDSFKKKLEQLIELGLILYPDTFTEDFVAVARRKVAILYTV